MVEAEGYYDQSSGVLNVRECEDEEDELEMKCEVTDISPDMDNPKVGLIECDFPGTTGGPLPKALQGRPIAAPGAGLGRARETR